jgi:hypothetical protein
MTRTPTDAARGPENGKQAAIVRTWDAQPLVDITGHSMRDVARQLGIDPALLCRPLSDAQADKYATRLGYHPTMVWGMDWLT